MGTICERLKAERIRLKTTQEQLANAGGVARSAQANYENGSRSPDADYLAAVAKVGVDVMYVLTGIRAISSVESLSPREVELVNNYKAMADEDKQAIERLSVSIQKRSS